MFSLQSAFGLPARILPVPQLLKLKYDRKNYASPCIICKIKYRIFLQHTRDSSRWGILISGGEVQVQKPSASESDHYILSSLHGTRGELVMTQMNLYSIRTVYEPKFPMLNMP